MIEIGWDNKKCKSPDECKECLDICPQGVFAMYAKGGRKPGALTKDWAIAPVWLSLCTGCEICEEICPQNALAVIVA